MRHVRMTVSDWAAVADSLHVDPWWMAEEADRQMTELVPTMKKVAGEVDISRYSCGMGVLSARRLLLQKAVDVVVHGHT